MTQVPHASPIEAERARRVLDHWRGAEPPEWKVDEARRDFHRRRRTSRGVRRPRVVSFALAGLLLSLALQVAAHGAGFVDLPFFESSDEPASKHSDSETRVGPSLVGGARAVAAPEVAEVAEEKAETPSVASFPDAAEEYEPSEVERQAAALSSAYLLIEAGRPEEARPILVDLMRNAQRQRIRIRASQLFVQIDRLQHRTMPEGF